MQGEDEEEEEEKEEAVEEYEVEREEEKEEVVEEEEEERNSCRFDREDVSTLKQQRDKHTQVSPKTGLRFTVMPSGAVGRRVQQSDCCGKNY